MLYVGLDLSRKRLDFDALADDGKPVTRGAVAADRDSLVQLGDRLAAQHHPVVAVIESMNGARFVHDQLEQRGWEVQIADARKAKVAAELLGQTGSKSDRLDARVLAELGRRDLVPAIWLPDPSVRAERERARFRLHLVRQRTRLKNRIHATLIAHGHPCPVSDLFGRRGRALLERLTIPEPWRGTLESLRVIDGLDREIVGCERELRRLGAEHRYVPLLMTVPGSPGCSPTRSPPSSAMSPASPARAS